MNRPVHIPQRASGTERAARERSLLEARHRLRLVREPRLPPRLIDAQEAAPELLLSPGSERYLKGRLRRAALNRVLSLGASRVRSTTPRRLSRYEELGPLISVPEEARGSWRDDRYFAWSFIAGVNPMSLRACEEVPAGFELGDGRVSALLPGGMTLEEALRSGRVFLVDLSEVGGLSCLRGRYLTAARALFVIDDAQVLRPLAIALGSERSCLTVTPLDGPWDWMSARGWLNSANNHVHQAVHHLLGTHFVGEVLSVTMRRNLAPEHPLYQLLEPHLRECVGINERARGLLLGAGGLVDRSMSAGGAGLIALIEGSWPGWRWSDHTLGADLERRGVASSASVQVFPYRDDARSVHGEMRAFVDEVVRGSYLADQEVAQDPEVQAWRAELIDPDCGMVSGVPTIRTLAELVDFATEVMFKVTAQHNAMQHGQHEAYGFAPATPAGLYTPPMTGLGEASESSFFEMLPPHGPALSQLGAAYILARPVERPLTRWPRSGGDSLYDRCLGGFQARLASVSARIEERNRQRFRPYTALDPAQMATCIDI